MDAAKTKKLEDYAVVLERQAQSEEFQGNGNEAAKIYVKLIDIFLLLAREAPDHPTWVKYATRAESLQKKTKELIANSNSENSQGKANAIKKILGIKSSEEKSIAGDVKPEKLQELAHVQSKLSAPPLALNQESIQSQEAMIPKRLYDELLERSKQLESRAGSMVERSDYEALEAKYTDANEKLSSMPSKSEYDELRHRLSNSVPRIQYEELQKAFVNLIPKDTYNAAQARIAELESQLENSIPKSVLDNLANEVSLLIVTAAIPMAQLGDIGRTSQIPIGAKDHNTTSLALEQNDIQEELLMMREKIDLLEVKIKASRADSAKA